MKTVVSRTMQKRSINKRALALIGIILVAIAIPLTIFILGQQQETRQHAASQADLAVVGFQLVDAGGNVKTVFGVNEEIYVRVQFKNVGTATAQSADGTIYSQFYKNTSSAVAPGTPSDTGITMHNGSYSAGAEKTYASNLNDPTTTFFRFGNAKSWHMTKAGKYTAQVYFNYNNQVPESNLANNHAFIQYEVQDASTYLDSTIKKGTTASSAPSGFSSLTCNQPGTISGVTGCVLAGALNGNAVAKITNASSVTATVGAAVYKAYYDYPSSDPGCTPAGCPDQYTWIWTQTLYSAKTITLNPGATAYVSLPVPSCNWQVDAFTGGSVFFSFLPPSNFYGGSGRLLGGGWLEQNSVSPCQSQIIPFVTPTPTTSPTATPTLPPGVTPTVTPTPTDTPTPTPSDTPTPTPTTPPGETPTPTPTPCPKPQPVTNVKVSCPTCAGAP